jgi:serine/threonine protein phosphatase PrpC
VGWNPGIKRKHAPNEDGIAAIQGTCTHKERIVPFDLFIVADGMGGHANGQEASRLAIQTMTQVVLQSIVMCGELNDVSFTEVLASGVQQANLDIWEYNREQSSDMGTTLTAALVVGAKAYVVNVGDSRTYLYRPTEGLLQITRDHSLVARLVANGVITPDEIYTHPRRNQIERSLGDKNRAQVDTFIVDLRKGDWLLLCSDGLWEMVRDPAIERIMKNVSDPAQMSDTLIQAALKGGGADNVSVIVARVA